jgi:hypothetical protein
MMQRMISHFSEIDRPDGIGRGRPLQQAGGLFHQISPRLAAMRCDPPSPRLLARGLAALALQPSDLEDLPKGAPEKIVLAWWLREWTSMSLRWVGQTLAMGHYTRVTQAVSRVGRQPGRKLE